MRRNLLLIAVLLCGVGVGWLLKSPSPSIVVSQPEPAKARVVASVTTKKNNQPSGDQFVTGGIEAIGFADTYVQQPESFNGGQVIADTTTSNPIQSHSVK